jgi:hypothetical protein
MLGGVAGHDVLRDLRRPVLQPCLHETNMAAVAQGVARSAWPCTIDDDPADGLDLFFGRDFLASVGGCHCCPGFESEGLDVCACRRPK